MKKTSNIEMGNLYDMNKQAMSKEKPITRTELKKKLREIKCDFLLYGHQYYMLLNRELYDFTLFNLTEKTEFNIASVISGLEECLENRGLVISIDKNEEQVYEIWIKKDNECYVYYLFSYDEGVIS
ncbi:MAG: hypothetical protein [Caudoviricetes sp.]|nr:MAG: hypothetical protein [Caudoviricetes sp.]